MEVYEKIQDCRDGRDRNVGREVIKTLAEREFPVGGIVALASVRSAGSEVSFGEDEVLTVQDLAKYDFKGTDICFGAAGSKVSAEFAPKAGKAGCVVIDKTSHFRMDPGCSVDRAGGQSDGAGRVHQEKHHRDAELLDHPDAGGFEAVA